MMKITIRAIELGDAAAVQSYAAEEKLARTCNVPHPYPENGGQWFVKSCVEARQKREHFTSAVLADGQFVGVVGLNALDFKAGTIECDYWIGVPHWNNGVGTRAVGLAVKFAFGELGMQTVFSGCWEGNPPSARVLEKNGFKEIESILGSDTYGWKKKGERIRRFKLTKQEWTTKHTEPTPGTLRA